MSVPPQKKKPPLTLLRLICPLLVCTAHNCTGYKPIVDPVTEQVYYFLTRTDNLFAEPFVELVSVDYQLQTVKLIKTFTTWNYLSDVIVYDAGASMGAVAVGIAGFAKSPSAAVSIQLSTGAVTNLTYPKLPFTPRITWLGTAWVPSIQTVAIFGNDPTYVVNGQTNYTMMYWNINTGEVSLDKRRFLFPPESVAMSSPRLVAVSYDTAIGVFFAAYEVDEAEVPSLILKFDPNAWTTEVLQTKHSARQVVAL